MIENGYKCHSLLIEVKQNHIKYGYEGMYYHVYGGYISLLF